MSDVEQVNLGNVNDEDLKKSEQESIDIEEEKEEKPDPGCANW